jgi:predicted house-cleaning noncanonical NTP pyrophosphatase (MazG superfamily)
MEELADVQAMIHLVVSAASFSPDYIEKLVDKRLEKMVNPHYE